MLEPKATAGVEAGVEVVGAIVARVCRRIPPLWDLPNYVAVNPFLGFAAEPLAEAARAVGDGLGAQILPGVDYYRERWMDGAFGPADLAGAAERLGQDPEALAAILAGWADAPTRPAGAAATFAERHDRRHGTDWDGAVIRSIARWCAFHLAAKGGSRAVAGSGLYASWLEAARVDRSLEIAGLRGWRAWIRRLPERPGAAIAALLDRLDVPDDEREPYLYRLLGGLYGWASYLRRASWERGSDEPGPLAELLAIRLAADAAVAELASGSEDGGSDPAPPEVEEESVRVALQEALEDGLVRTLLGKLHPPSRSTARVRPAAQAVFCIDVRSEPMRRHLEAQSSAIETRGFAGFFGVALDWHADGRGSARCPVLLKPAVRVRAPGEEPSLPAGAVKYLQTAPGAAFTFVETLGPAYALGLVGDALAALPTRRHSEGTAAFGLEPDGHGCGIPLEDRLDLAAGILKNLGLRDSFRRIVLLCGHGGRSANNPHAAGLDCGACGGHGGAINARVAAAVLNDPAIRAALPARGWAVPEDTVFVAGVHDTSVDEVTLFDAERIPASHQADLDRLRRWLARAGERVRRERAGALGLADRPANLLDRLLRRRARDWSEVRPEWGLARNAAFIAARRQRTRGVDLEGRTFLHEYDWTTDPDNSVLTLILSAPMVVASWINLQYFASTVDNRVFGCGTKTLHNRVGTLGVVLGNGGDLRTGLAAQSVHAPDGSWYHEPVRLQVVVEAPRERIDLVLRAQRGVRDLVANGWVRLFALDPEGTGTSRYVPGRGWERVEEVNLDLESASTP